MILLWYNDNVKYNYWLKILIFSYRQLTPRFAMPKYEGDRNFSVEFIPVAVNICNLRKGLRTRAILKLLLDTFLNNLEEELICPVKKV